jgi:hypothetical protein
VNRQATDLGAVPPRSPSEVERIFLDHGIQLSAVGTGGVNIGPNVRVGDAFLVGPIGGALVNVQVHLTVERDRYYSSLTPKGQKAHVAFARNVTATWGWPDLPAVRVQGSRSPR